MKFFTVYKKPSTSNEECLLIENSFSWKNFFFGIFWAAYKRIWDLVLIHLLFISVVVSLLSFYPVFRVQIIVVALSVQMLLSFYVKSFFLKWKLMKLGYQEIDLVAGQCSEDALLRFLDGAKKT